jgi:hypothetical protein
VDLIRSDASQPPFHTGLRFSANALNPSSPSTEARSWTSHPTFVALVHLEAVRDRLRALEAIEAAS